jgi:putative hydrolase of the HAD superfamily
LNRLPEALLLDALGTLVALEPPAPKLRRALLGGFGVSVSERDAERAIAAEIAYYRSHLDEGRDEATLPALRRACAQAMGEALPSEARERLDPDALLSALLESLEFSVFEDVRPSLRELRDRGLRLVVVSNWDVSLTEVLRRLELTSMLDGVVTSAEAGARKPAAEIFHRALRLARVRPRQAAYVGDNVVEDVEGASAAGIEAILLRRDGSPGLPGVKTIGSLSELVAALQQESPVGEP